MTDERATYQWLGLLMKNVGEPVTEKTPLDSIKIKKLLGWTHIVCMMMNASMVIDEEVADTETSSSSSKSGSKKAVAKKKSTVRKIYPGMHELVMKEFNDCMDQHKITSANKANAHIRNLIDRLLDPTVFSNQRYYSTPRIRFFAAVIMVIDPHGYSWGCTKPVDAKLIEQSISIHPSWVQGVFDKIPIARLIPGKPANSCWTAPMITLMVKLLKKINDRGSATTTSYPVADDSEIPILHRVLRKWMIERGQEKLFDDLAANDINSSHPHIVDLDKDDRMMRPMEYKFDHIWSVAQPSSTDDNKNQNIARKDQWYDSCRVWYIALYNKMLNDDNFGAAAGNVGRKRAVPKGDHKSKIIAAFEKCDKIKYVLQNIQWAKWRDEFLRPVDPVIKKKAVVTKKRKSGADADDANKKAKKTKLKPKEGIVHLHPDFKWSADISKKYTLDNRANVLVLSKEELDTIWQYPIAHRPTGGKGSLSRNSETPATRPAVFVMNTVASSPSEQYLYKGPYDISDPKIEDRIVGILHRADVERNLLSQPNLLKDLDHVSPSIGVASSANNDNKSSSALNVASPTTASQARKYDEARYVPKIDVCIENDRKNFAWLRIRSATQVHQTSYLIKHIPRKSRRSAASAAIAKPMDTTADGEESKEESKEEKKVIVDPEADDDEFLSVLDGPAMGIITPMSVPSIVYEAFPSIAWRVILCLINRFVCTPLVGESDLSVMSNVCIALPKPLYHMMIRSVSTSGVSGDKKHYTGTYPNEWNDVTVFNVDYDENRATYPDCCADKSVCKKSFWDHVCTRNPIKKFQAILDRTIQLHRVEYIRKFEVVLRAYKEQLSAQEFQRLTCANKAFVQLANKVADEEIVADKDAVAADEEVAEAVDEEVVDEEEAEVSHVDDEDEEEEAEEDEAAPVAKKVAPKKKKSSKPTAQPQPKKKSAFKPIQKKKKPATAADDDDNDDVDEEEDAQE